MKRLGLRGVVLRVLVGLFVALGAGPVESAELAAWATGSEPIQVDSQSLEARAEEGVILFQGEVVARQGDLTLQADSIEVQADPETRAIRQVEARGSVRIQKAEMVATGAQASYDVQAGVLVLSGDAKAWRGRSVVAGERITLYLAENRSVVKGAKAILYPGEPEADEK